MKESEIRPKKIFDKFLELAKKDTIAYFNKSDKLKIKCPACNSRGKYSFSKDNFDYCSCSTLCCSDIAILFISVDSLPFGTSNGDMSLIIV